MGQKAPAIDQYIAKAPEYARPILKKIRTLMHEADLKIVETVKWSNPAFERDGILAGMAAFKNYVGLGFWRHKHLKHPAARALETTKITSLADLPADDELIACIREAIALNQPGNKPKTPARAPKAPLPMPKDFAAALKAKPKAHAAFQTFPPSHKREYIEWIIDAKQDATRTRRIDQAIGWIAEGKSRNWKYQ